MKIIIQLKLDYSIYQKLLFIFKKNADFFKLPINSDKLTGDSIVSNLKIKKAIVINKITLHMQWGIK